MPTYDPKTQWKAADKDVVVAVLKACYDMKADRVETVAAFETIIVESGARNLAGGDLDSVGPFQQRAGWGSYATRRNPYKSAVLFLDAARAVRKRYTRASQLAYAVQRCAYAYRDRYRQAYPAAKYMIVEAEKLYTQRVAASVIKPTHPVVVFPPKPSGE